MTTYDQAESSAAASRPVELVSFEIGSSPPYRYTTAPLDLTVAGNAYVAQPGLSRSGVVLGASANDQTVSVELPANNAFAALYVDIVPAEVAVCTILRVNRGESPSFATTQLVFQGRVKAVKFSPDKRKASIGVQSREASFNKQMAAYTFQGPCNHQLYSPLCGSDPAAHTFTGTVAAVSGATITVSGLDASGMDFVGGYCHPTATSDFRMVIAQAVDVLTLLLPFAQSPLGQSIDVLEGCDHTLEDCANLHDRVVAFGGFAWCPGDSNNPFRTGVAI